VKNSAFFGNEESGFCGIFGSLVMVIKKMGSTQVLRQIGTVALLPAYILIGMVVSDMASKFTGIWDYYYFAMFIPLLGLVGTWIVAPFYRIYNLLYVYLLGVILAYFFALPAYYPENHPLAYTSTYTPFVLTVLWGAILAGIFIFYELHRKEP
jgi:hypothetical protein